MASQPKLHLSPFVLSNVMFDNSNSLGDQEGFLIGHALKSVRREISDQSMYNTEEDLIISIYSCIPCGAYLTFYDSCGNVNESYIDDFLGERKNSVVGWYRYRRNLVAFPSAREMIVHKNLKKLFPGNISFGDEYFAFGVYGSACYPTTATHTYDYAFFVQKSESFRSLPITLLNLGDTKTEYRGGSLSSSFIDSATFNSVLDIPWDFSSCWQTEDAMLQMHKMLREKCDSLAEELAASESVNSIIEQEVMKLDSELESLTIKEPVESVGSEMELDNSENIPPEKVYPFTGKHAKLFGKRNLKDLIDFNEELHPLFGKYFPQNRNQEPGCSYHFTGEVSGINYNFLPPKKKIKVILQERRRILDHDYDIASDEDPPHQFVPETDEESSDTYETGYLSSDAAGYLQEEDIQFNQVEEFEISTEVSGASSSTDKVSKEFMSSNEEPKVKVVYLDNRKNVSNIDEVGVSDVNINCPEPVHEEVVNSVCSESSKSESKSFLPSPSKASNISQDQGEMQKSDVEGKEIQQEKELKECNVESPCAVKHARPMIVFCKRANKDEKAPDSAN